MSRSYKKVPGYTDYSRDNTKWAKRQASRKVRHSEDVPDRRAYRKLYNPWNIRDWKSLYFYPSDFIRNRWTTERIEPSVKDIYRAKMK